MILETKFFIALQQAKNTTEIDAAINEFEQAQGPLNWVPVGNIPNNRSVIHLASDPAIAFFERVTNGIDACIEYQQTQNPVLFSTITTPLEAMEAIISDKLNRTDELSDQDIYNSPSQIDPLVYVIATKANDKTPTITVGDVGLGIEGHRFPDTILSLLKENKATKPYCCGTHNMGGSSTFHFANVTIIASISHTNPNKVYFTLVRKIHKPGWKVETFVYAKTPEGVFSCLTSDLSYIRQNLIDVSNEQLEFDAYNKVFLPSEHGTVIRHVGYKMRSGSHEMKEILRELGFGIPLNIRHRFFLGKNSSNQEDNYKNIGLRYALRTNSVTQYPVLHTKKWKFPCNSLSCHRTDDTQSSQSSFMTIEYWLMDSLTNNKPTSILSDHVNPIFITLNGQTHARLPTKVLLRDEFSFIDGHLIIEVNCDLLDMMNRNIFTSNRQSIDDDSRPKILDLIKDALKNDPEIKRLNKMFAERMRAQANTAFQNEKFARLINTKLAGLFSNYGATSLVSENIISEKIDKGTKFALNTPQSVQNPTVAINDPPTFVRLCGKEINEIGHTIISVVTDAPESYTNIMLVNLPDFLEEIPNLRVSFKKGHGAFQVRIKQQNGTPMARAGVTGSIQVTIPLADDKFLDSGQKDYTVVPAQTRMRKTKIGIPEILAEYVNPMSSAWVNIEQGNAKVEDVAYLFQYHRGNDEQRACVYVWINEKYHKYTEMLDYLNKRKRYEAAKHLTENYKLSLMAHAFPYVEMSEEKIGSITSEQRHVLNAATADGILVAEVLRVENLIPTNFDEDATTSTDETDIGETYTDISNATDTTTIMSVDISSDHETMEQRADRIRKSHGMSARFGN